MISRSSGWVDLGNPLHGDSDFENQNEEGVTILDFAVTCDFV